VRELVENGRTGVIAMLWPPRMYNPFVHHRRVRGLLYYVALLEQKLKDVGFDVVTVCDAGLGALTHAVNAYGGRAAERCMVHRVGAPIPVEVKTTETGAPWDQSIALTDITRIGVVAYVDNYIRGRR
jgi:hypothetical protein